MLVHELLQKVHVVYRKGGAECMPNGAANGGRQAVGAGALAGCSGWWWWWDGFPDALGLRAGHLAALRCVLYVLKCVWGGAKCMSTI